MAALRALVVCSIFVERVALHTPIVLGQVNERAQGRGYGLEQTF